MNVKPHKIALTKAFFKKTIFVRFQKVKKRRKLSVNLPFTPVMVICRSDVRGKDTKYIRELSQKGTYACSPAGGSISKSILWGIHRS